MIRYILFVSCIFLCMQHLIQAYTCHKKCGEAPWHIAGMCNTETGRCQCFYGWTGPNSRYLPDTRNKLEADYCSEACHYTHDYKNQKCTYLVQKPVDQVKRKKCSRLCGHVIYYYTGKCMKDIHNQMTGKCLCWWGWTGPGAEYRDDGRIMADYCVLPCHYTAGFSNPVCAMTKEEKTELQKKYS